MPSETAVGVPLHVLPGQYFEKPTSPSLRLGAFDDVSFLASLCWFVRVTYSDIIEQKFTSVYSLGGGVLWKFSPGRFDAKNSSNRLQERPITCYSNSRDNCHN